MSNRATSYLSKACVLAALLVPHTAMAAEDIDSSYDIPGDGLVRVENMAGSVSFTAWDRDEVHIRGRVADDVEEVDIETTSNGIRIQVRNKRNQRNIDGTQLHLKVPVGASIEAEGVSSDLSVGGSRGVSIMLTTVSGDVEVDAESERVELASVSGDVEFEGSAGRINAESVSGDVTLIGIREEVESSTVSGDITLEGEMISNGRFETVSGDLNLVLALAADGRLNCDAMSGDINLRLPGSQEAAFFAQTFSGTIQTEFGDPRQLSKSPSGSTLKASTGDNGARVRLETFSGDISIRSD
jgi:DUF4097 and DUF4098 domain-containing protein YvlB